MNSIAKNFLNKHQIHPDDILYILRESKKTSIYLKDNRIFSTYITMKDIVSALPESEFVRINKSYVLPVSQIASVDNGMYTMKDGRVFAGRVRDKASHRRIAETYVNSSPSEVHAAPSTPGTFHLSTLMPMAWNGFLQTMRQNSFDALLATYYKILKVDLTNDNFIILKDDEEKNLLEITAVFSDWLHGFIKSGRVHSDDLNAFRNYTSLEFLRSFFLHHKSKAPYCMQYRRKSYQDYRWALMEIVPAEDYSPSLQTVYLFVRDIQDTLNDSELMLNTVLRGLCSNYQAIYSVDFVSDKVSTYRMNPNESFCFGQDTVTGMTFKASVDVWLKNLPEALRVQLYNVLSFENISNQLENKDTFSYEFKFEAHNDDHYFRITCSRLEKQSQLENAVIAFEDISQEKRLSGYEHDPLTGLYEKNAFYRYASVEIRNHPEKQYYILCADIDSFRFANEQLGTEVCDEILFHIANSVRDKMPGYVFGSRFYADVFAFLICDTTPGTMKQISSYISSTIFKRNLIVRFGITHADDSAAVRVHCDHARFAIQKIKGSYHQRFEEYDDTIHQQVMMNFQLNQTADLALSEEQFFVYYQPKLDLLSGKIGGAEALVRWKHPEMGFVSNTNFIPLYERSGFVLKLDTYVLTKICTDMAEWLKDGYSLVPVSVNLSRVDFEDVNLPGRLVEIIDSFEIPHSLIHFEITESAFITNASKVERYIKELAEMGFQIELDDFGTGYSSLTTLGTLDLRILKLDKTLIDRMFTDKGSKILHSSVTLAQTMNMKVVAEGVETKEQLDFLKGIGCDYIQGYYYSTPLPAHEYITFLKDQI